MPLYMTTGNRLEGLADRLAEVLQVPLSDPMAPEILVVPSRGLARWLAMELARRLGVSANLEFPFPDHLVKEMGRRLLPGAPEADAFEPSVLSWRMYQLLPRISAGPNGAPLMPFVVDDGDPMMVGIKRYQLAQRLAGCFELYTVFRPDLLEGWESGAEAGDWQASLWRALTEGVPGAHRGAIMRQIVDALPGAGEEQFPERVCVFGLGTLAPSRLDFLAALATRTDVHIFAVNPSQQYWSDIRSEGEIAREARRKGETAPRLAAEVGNPLLASFGRLGREFFEQLAGLPAIESPPCFSDPVEDHNSLLAWLQSDVLHLRHRGVDPAVPAVELLPDDLSLQVHACHSPLREVEVLHDQLLALFRDMEALEPRQVLIATPDVATYGPLIRAVFDGCQDEPRRIPYTIADRSARASSVAADGFLRLLAMPGSRHTATEVLDLLDIAPVRERFGISVADRDTVIAWVREVCIRWGRDAEARRAMDLPAFDANTWQAGLDRLLLGYMLPGDGERCFEGVLPYPHIEGDAGRVLGNLMDFTGALFSLDEQLREPRTLAQWADALLALVETFFRGDEEHEVGIQALRAAVVDLADLGRAARIDEQVPFGVIRAHLHSVLEDLGTGGGYLAGVVTVCALRPLRSIPFRVVALVGMNDGAFPRVTRAPGFDRMARDPRTGDPSPRDEDRYLFLETLLAARERLYISYVGQSVRDNSPIPPSVLVSELLDSVSDGFRLPGKELPEGLVTRHRLQAFHPSYFTPDSGLASCSTENLAAVQALVSERRTACEWVPSPLPEPEPEWRGVPLHLLAGFFGHPTRTFVTRRMGIRVGEEEYGLEDNEPFEVGGLERYRIEDDLVERVLAGSAPEDLEAVLHAEGRLPPGSTGEVAFGKLRGSVQSMVATLKEHRESGALEPLDIDLEVGRFRIHGRLSGVWRDGMLRYRPAKMKAKAQLWAWVDHLVLNTLSPAGYPRSTVLVCRDEGCEFGPVEGAETILEGLLEHYWAGLCKPLHLFPQTSFEYQKSKRNPRQEDQALTRARKVWEGDDFRPGEAQDDYLDLCFGGCDPLDSTFEELALEVFDPLADHRSKR